MKSTWVFCFFLASFWGRFSLGSEYIYDYHWYTDDPDWAPTTTDEPDWSTITTEPKTCEEEWMLNGDECLWISKDKLNFDAANDKCKEMESQLAKIEDAQLWSFIKQYLDDTAWIGIDDRQEEGVYRWTSDNSTTTFFKWVAEESDSYWTDGLDCLALRKESLYYYTDEPCQWPYLYVCQKATKNKKVECPVDYFYSEGLCYHISTVKGNWTEGSKYCNNKGGTYAKVVTKQQLDALAGEAQDNTWIGLNDLDKEGTFVWESDGTPTFTNWCRKEPNNKGEEDCVHFGDDIGDKCWNDNKCTKWMKFLCETKQVQGECPDGFDKFQDSCYFISEEKATWYRSKESCEDKGAYLAKMSTAEENEFIRGNLTEDIWFGLSDLKNEGEFIWTKDNEYAFANLFVDDLYQYWGPFAEDCIHLWKPYSYMMNDAKCDAEYYFACSTQPLAV